MKGTKIAIAIIIVLYVSMATITSYGVLMGSEKEFVFLDGPMTFSGEANSYIMNSNVVILTINARGKGGYLAANSLTVDNSTIHISYFTMLSKAYITLNSLPEKVTIDGEEYTVRTVEGVRSVDVFVSTIILLGLVVMLVAIGYVLVGDVLDFETGLWIATLFVIIVIPILELLYTSAWFNSLFTKPSTQSIIFSIAPAIVGIYGLYTIAVIARNNVRQGKRMFAFFVAMLILFAGILGVSCHNTKNYIMINGYGFEAYGTNKYQYDGGISTVYTIAGIGRPIKNHTVIEDRIITMSKYPGMKPVPAVFGYDFAYHGNRNVVAAEVPCWANPLTVIIGIVLGAGIACVFYQREN